MPRQRTKRNHDKRQFTVEHVDETTLHDVHRALKTALRTGHKITGLSQLRSLSSSQKLQIYQAATRLTDVLIEIFGATVDEVDNKNEK